MVGAFNLLQCLESKYPHHMVKNKNNYFYPSVYFPSVIKKAESNITWLFRFFIPHTLNVIISHKKVNERLMQMAYVHLYSLNICRRQVRESDVLTVQVHIYALSIQLETKPSKQAKFMLCWYWIHSQITLLFWQDHSIPWSHLIYKKPLSREYFCFICASCNQ